MKALGEENGRRLPEPDDGTSEAVFSIEALVWKCVEDVESRDPGRDGRADRQQQPDGWLHRPVTARYPPTGAMARLIPSHKCGHQVKRFERL